MAAIVELMHIYHKLRAALLIFVLGLLEANTHPVVAICLKSVWFCCHVQNQHLFLLGYGKSIAFALCQPPKKKIKEDGGKNKEMIAENNGKNIGGSAVSVCRLYNL